LQRNFTNNVPPTPKINDRVPTNGTTSSSTNNSFTFNSGNGSGNIPSTAASNPSSININMNNTLQQAAARKQVLKLTLKPSG
jgi:hypothetical protein